ncbi:hypothetical protein D6829_01280 [Candidatus Pacearchaeota archaeon]|nr:MAG: hypothetical protein D6829_01280 [Candidatus Pacearchaeota archaeon]
MRKAYAITAVFLLLVVLALAQTNTTNQTNSTNNSTQKNITNSTLGDDDLGVGDDHEASKAPSDEDEDSEFFEGGSGSGDSRDVEFKLKDFDLDDHYEKKYEKLFKEWLKVKKKEYEIPDELKDLISAAEGLDFNREKFKRFVKLAIKNHRKAVESRLKYEFFLAMALRELKTSGNNSNISLSDLDLNASSDFEDFESWAKEVGESSWTDFWERTSLWFTSDRIKRIDKYLKLAERRLIRAVRASDNLDDLKEASAEYEDFMKSVEEEVLKLEKGLADKGASEEELARLAKVQARIEKHKARALEVLSRIESRLDSGGDSEIFGELKRFKDKPIEIENRIIGKRKNLEIRLKRLKGLDDKKLREISRRIDKESGVQFAKEMALRKEAHFEKERLKKAEEIAKVKAKFARLKALKAREKELEKKETEEEKD